MPTQRSRPNAKPSEAEGVAAAGADAYPYDATLELESQRGLDRLRCIPDRALAANLFVLFQVAERNTAAAARGDSNHSTELAALRALASRAFNGELGAKPQELAQCLLLDDGGTCATDERSLREFALALRQLRKLAG